MAYKLDRLEIRPAENGGHTVRHEFKRKVANRKGGMNGGLYMDRPEPEEHTFGPDDGEQVMAHVSKALGLHRGAKPKPEAAED